METATRTYIEELNQHARSLDLDDPAGAVETTANVFGLTEVGRSDYCVLYRTPAGQYVNCWMDAEGNMTDRIEDGGLGFDDQIEIHEDTARTP